MSKERLEEIKREYKKDVYDCKLGRFEIDWLIKQTERVPELEQQNEELAFAYNNAQKEIVILKNKVNNKNEV